MASRREFLRLGGLSIATFGFVNDVLAHSPTLQSKLQNMIADVQPPTPEDYEARRENARRLLTEQKLDGLFLIGGADLVYFTGVSMWVSERTTGVILSQKGTPTWVVPAFELEGWKESIPAGHEIRPWEEHESPFKLIGKIMNDLGHRNARLGIGPAVRSFMLFGLRADAPSLELLPGAPVTEACRCIKSAKEIAYLDLANRITKLAYGEAFKSLREGMTPQELSTAVSAAHRQLGVTGGASVQLGPSTAFPHGSRVPRTLRDGDVVMVDGGCGVEGYRSDVTRTIVFGKPTEKQRQVWEIVRRAQMQAHTMIRPGVTCEQVDAVARKVIEDSGYGPGYRYFTHRLGHGIGLEGHEYPYLVKGNTLALAPGMTFSNEPGIYIYGEFGIRIEDCFVVTEEGARFLGGMEATAIDEPFGKT